MIRVAICDDHAIVRKGLTMILSQTGDISVVAEAESFGDLRQRLRGVECDVLLIDIEMPGKTGIEAVALLKKEQPKLAAIVLSMHTEDQYAVRALRAGASGYLNKSTAPEKLVDAVRHVAGGRKYVTPEMSKALADMVAGDTPESPHNELSDRDQTTDRAANPHGRPHDGDRGALPRAVHGARQPGLQHHRGHQLTDHTVQEPAEHHYR